MTFKSGSKVIVTKEGDYRGTKATITSMGVDGDTVMYGVILKDGHHTFISSEYLRKPSRMSDVPFIGVFFR